MTAPGPQSLGRIPSPPDERDYRLENFLGATATVVDTWSAAVELRLTTTTYKRWAATTYADVTTTHWWRAFNFLGQIAPPPPPTGDIVWADPETVLDQGAYGTCVGNGFAQWGNTLPIDDHYTETDARAIYYEATVLDGAPDDPDAKGGGQQGATVRSGAKAMLNRQRLAVYAFAGSIDTVRAWLRAKGPVVFGTEWTDAMFNPDAHGYVSPTGGVAGGHCYLAVGDISTEGALEFLNSWGDSWGLGGHFRMTYADAAKLLSQQGEAVTAVELAT